MEIKELAPWILMLIITGVILGAGILVIDSLGEAARWELDGSEEIAVDGTGTVTDTPISEVTRFGNATVSTTTFNVVGATVNYSDTTGVFTVNAATFPAQDYDVNYTYYDDSDATTALASVTTAVSSISSTWLTLIITIVVLSIILGIVIKSFAFGGR